MDFYANGSFINSAFGFPYTITWNNVAALSSYALTAIAFDNTGATGNSPAVNITVNPPSGSPSVSISAPQPNARFTAPANISITALASACCGRTINKVEFFANGGLIGTDTVAPYNATFNSSVVSSHTLMARVTDSINATADSAPITVFIDSQAPPPPGDNFSNARIDLINRTGQPGEDLFSRNFNWSAPLAALAGRAGLDLSLSLTRRYNVEFPTDITKAAEYSTGYNTTGSVIFSRDPLSHQTTISYADSFADYGYDASRADARLFDNRD